MSPKKLYSFMIEPEMAEALKQAKAQAPHLSEGAIIREALGDWLKKNSRAYSKALERDLHKQIKVIRRSLETRAKKRRT